MSKAKVIFFDMDGVLFDVSDYAESNKKISASIWKAVFDKLDILSEHKRLKQMFVEKQFPSYMEWTDKACQILKENKLVKNIFLDIVDARVPMIGAKETIEILKGRGYKTGLITGTFNALAERAKKELGIEYTTSHCKLIFNDDGTLFDWELIPCDFDGKVDYYHKMLRELGLEPEKSIYVGDEINDIPLFKESCLSIAFNCSKQEVKDAANIVVESCDLRDILKYIEY